MGLQGRLFRLQITKIINLKNGKNYKKNKK